MSGGFLAAWALVSLIILAEAAYLPSVLPVLRCGDQKGKAPLPILLAQRSVGGGGILGLRGGHGFDYGNVETEEIRYDSNGVCSDTSQHNSELDMDEIIRDSDLPPEDRDRDRTPPVVIDAEEQMAALKRGSPEPDDKTCRGHREGQNYNEDRDVIKDKDFIQKIMPWATKPDDDPGQAEIWENYLEDRYLETGMLNKGLKDFEELRAELKKQGKSIPIDKHVNRIFDENAEDPDDKINPGFLQRHAWEKDSKPAQGGDAGAPKRHDGFERLLASHGESQADHDTPPLGQVNMSFADTASGGVEKGAGGGARGERSTLGARERSDSKGRGESPWKGHPRAKVRVDDVAEVDVNPGLGEMLGKLSLDSGNQSMDVQRVAGTLPETEAELFEARNFARAEAEQEAELSRLSQLGRAAMQAADDEIERGANRGREAVSPALDNEAVLKDWDVLKSGGVMWNVGEFGNRTAEEVMKDATSSAAMEGASESLEIGDQVAFLLSDGEEEYGVVSAFNESSKMYKIRAHRMAYEREAGVLRRAKRASLQLGVQNLEGRDELGAEPLNPNPFVPYETVTVREEVARWCDDFAGHDEEGGDNLSFDERLKRKMESIEMFGDETIYNIVDPSFGPVDGQAVFRCDY